MTRASFFELLAEAKRKARISDSELARRTNNTLEKLRRFENGTNNYTINRVLDYLAPLRAELCLQDSANRYIITNTAQMAWTLTAIRKSYRLKQHVMAEVMGVTTRDLVNLEVDASILPTDSLLKLCEWSNIDVSITTIRALEHQTRMFYQDRLRIWACFYLGGLAIVFMCTMAYQWSAAVVAIYGLLGGWVALPLANWAMRGTPYIKRQLIAKTRKPAILRLLKAWGIVIGLLALIIGPPLLGYWLACQDYMGPCFIVFALWVWLIGYGLMDHSPYRNR